MIEDVCGRGLCKRGEFLRGIHTAKFTVGVVRNFLCTLLDRLELRHKFGLVVFGQTVMCAAHVDSGIDSRGTRKADFRFLRRADLLNVVPVLRRGHPQPLQLHITNAVFSVLNAHSKLPPADVMKQSPVAVPRFTLMRKL